MTTYYDYDTGTFIWFLLYVLDILGARPIQGIEPGVVAADGAQDGGFRRVL